MLEDHLASETVVKSFTRTDMLRHDPLNAPSVLYLDLGVTVQMIPNHAPVDVEANGWLWVRYFHTSSRRFISGWIHPEVLGQ